MIRLLAVPMLVGVTLLGACTTPAALSEQPATAESSPVSTSASPTPASTPSPTTSTSSPTSTAAAPVARTRETLTGALLTLDDMPSGFSVEPNSAEGGTGGGLSSKSATCKALLELFNTPGAPGSKASAQIGFSAGQNGPLIGESLDALADAAAVTALHTRIKDAVAACPKVSLSIKGVGTSTVQVRTVKAPAAGTSTAAVRFSAESGPLQGFELTFVTAAVGDVVMSMQFLGAFTDEVESATMAAFGKAGRSLGGTTPVA